MERACYDRARTDPDFMRKYLSWDPCLDADIFYELMDLFVRRLDFGARQAAVYVVGHFTDWVTAQRSVDLYLPPNHRNMLRGGPVFYARQDNLALEAGPKKVA